MVDDREERDQVGSTHKGHYIEPVVTRTKEDPEGVRGGVGDSAIHTVVVRWRDSQVPIHVWVDGGYIDKPSVWDA